MKFSTNYFINNPILNEVDEINLLFSERDTLKATIDFFQKYEKKFINVFIDDEILENSLRMLIMIHKKYPEFNMKIVFNRAYGKDLNAYIEQLRQEDIKYYFNSYICSWDTLYGYIGLGVSDVIIAGELGFELSSVVEVAEAAKVRIRVIPHIATSTWAAADNGLKSYWIRPNDVDIYEGLIDVMEISSLEPGETKILYKVYAKDKDWFGDLSEIISNLNIPIDNRNILFPFSIRRTHCGKKCLKNKPCNICELMCETANNLRDNHYIIKHNKID